MELVVKLAAAYSYAMELVAKLATVPRRAAYSYAMELVVKLAAGPCRAKLRTQKNPEPFGSGLIVLLISSLA